MPEPIGTATSPASTPITLETIVIEGRPPRVAPTCEGKLQSAVLSCSLGAASLVASVLGSAGGLSLGTFLRAVKEGLSCARVITEYSECKEEGAARTAAANRCEADGGVAVAGVEKSEVVCLQQP